jgi:hypothetical protein
VRRHVAGESGIGVFAPGAADAVGLFVDRVIPILRRVQLDGRQDAGHAGPDDDDSQVTLICRFVAQGVSSPMRLRPRLPPVRHRPAIRTPLVQRVEKANQASWGEHSPCKSYRSPSSGRSSLVPQPSTPRSASRLGPFRW